MKDIVTYSVDLLQLEKHAMVFTTDICRMFTGCEYVVIMMVNLVVLQKFLGNFHSTPV